MGFAVTTVVGVASTQAASQSASVTVSMTVPSATDLDVSTGCPPSTPDVTDFGIVLPGSQDVTGTGCTVSFGSSNDTVMLRLAQADGLGTAMYQSTRGAFDLAFDGDTGPGDGIVVNDLGGGDMDWARSVTIDAQNRILALGSIDDGCCFRGVTLSRYLADGTLDTSFDGDGIAVPNLPELGWEYGEDLALQDDGSFVIGGWGTNGSDQDMLFARLLPDGTPDPGFAGDGDVSYQYAPADNAYLLAVAVQDDGRIVGVGNNNEFITVARLNTDGSLDTTFDGPGPPGDGAFLLDATANFDYGEDVAVQPDGKIVVAGYTGWGSPDWMVFARLNADGSLDTTFDGPGPPGDGSFGLQFNPGLDSGAASVIVARDGDIVATGWADNGTDYDAVLVRLNPDGSLDTGFSGDGRVVVAGGTGYQDGLALVEQEDGRILVTGTVQVGGDDQVFVARVTADGNIDADLDADSGAGAGLITTDVTATDDVGRDIALLPDGDIVVAGSTDGTAGDTLILRFGGIALPDYDGASYGFGTEMFGACLTGTSAVADWTVNASCPATDGAYWNPVGTTAAKVAHTSAAGTVGATVNLQFGVSLLASQSPGSYVAPITFEAVAPDV